MRSLASTTQDDAAATPLIATSLDLTQLRPPTRLFFEVAGSWVSFGAGRGARGKSEDRHLYP